MKTIEQRANEYAPYPLDSDAILSMKKRYIVELRQIGFVAGAKSEHEELTKWNSPECPPDDDRDVLLKVKSAAGRIFFVVGFHESSGWNGYEMYLSQEQKSILGWREIHEQA